MGRWYRGSRTLCWAVTALAVAWTTALAGPPGEAPVEPAGAEAASLEGTLGELISYLNALEVSSDSAQLDGAADELAALRRRLERATDEIVRRSAADVVGRPQRPRLGALVQDMTASLRAFFGAEGDTGVLVTLVQRESAAHAAGIQAGDVIVQFAGLPVTDVDGLGAIVRDCPSGEVRARILRELEPLELTIELE